MFYVDAAGTLTSVSVQTTGTTFAPGNPAKVFDTKYAMPTNARNYDVSLNGQRFLMIKAGTTDDTATPTSVVVVEHWFEELKAKVPIK